MEGFGVTLKTSMGLALPKCYKGKVRQLVSGIFGQGSPNLFDPYSTVRLYDLLIGKLNHTKHTYVHVPETQNYHQK